MSVETLKTCDILQLKVAVYVGYTPNLPTLDSH